MATPLSGGTGGKNAQTRDKSALDGFMFLSFREVLNVTGPFPTRQDREKSNPLLKPYSSNDKTNHNGRPILLLLCSHNWQTIDHPDPDQTLLNCLKRFIKNLFRIYATICDNPHNVANIEAIAEETEENIFHHGWLQAAILLGEMLTSTSGVIDLQLHDDPEKFLDMCYVWYDYSCLYQHPRNPEQERDFRWSLDNMDKLTRNCSRTIAIFDDEKNYHARGWCVFEMASSYFDRLRPIVLRKDLMGQKLEFGPNHDKLWKSWKDDAPLHLADRMLLRRKLFTLVYSIQDLLNAVRSTDIQMRYQGQLLLSGSPTILPLIVELREGLKKQHAFIVDNRLSLFDFQKVFDEIDVVKCTNGADKSYVILKTLMVFLPAFDSYLFKEALNRYSQGLPLTLIAVGQIRPSTEWFKQQYTFDFDGPVFRFGDFGDSNLPVIDVTGEASYLTGQTVPGYLNSIFPDLPFNPDEVPDRPNPLASVGNREATASPTASGGVSETFEQEIYTQRTPRPVSEQMMKRCCSVFASPLVCIRRYVSGHFVFFEDFFDVFKNGPQRYSQVEGNKPPDSLDRNEQNSDQRPSFVVPQGMIATFDFSSAPISRIIAAAGLDDSTLAQRLFKVRFPMAQVGIFVNGGPTTVQSGKVLTSGADYDMQLPSHRGPNNERVIKLCADPEIFNQSFPGQFNAVLSGREAIDMAIKMQGLDGLLVCSGTAWRSFIIFKHEFLDYMAQPIEPSTRKTPDDCNIEVYFDKRRPNVPIGIRTTFAVSKLET